MRKGCNYERHPGTLQTSGEEDPKTTVERIGMKRQRKDNLITVIEAVVPADPTVIPTKVSIRHLVSEYYDWTRRTKRLDAYDDNGQMVGRLKALTKCIRTPLEVKPD